MEIRIGIKENGRDIGFETDKSAKDMAEHVKQGMQDGMLQLEDNKGRSYLIPATSVAYIEIGAEESRRVGFLA
jgi:hypothetical protein